uniref:Uncharacterized protein n=1 Tax=uncultured bacterium contig00100 TaxID=1181567 RepID=A0A806JZ83_9BACT|nr:hypothetical protein [uncultured bacterium contig00100]
MISASSFLLIDGIWSIRPPSCLIAPISVPSILEQSNRKLTGSCPLIHSIRRASSLPASWSRASTTATTRIFALAANRSSIKRSFISWNFVMVSLSSSSVIFSQIREIKYRSILSTREERDDIPQQKGSIRQLSLISSITLHNSPLLPLPASPCNINSCGFVSSLKQNAVISAMAATRPAKCAVRLSRKASCMSRSCSFQFDGVSEGSPHSSRSFAMRSSATISAHSLDTDNPFSLVSVV